MADRFLKVSAKTLADILAFVRNPPGGGDMLRSVYDVGNTGTVDEAKDSDTLDGQHAAYFAVASHATAHQNDGADELSVAGLSGELVDPQPAKAHTHPGGEVTSQVGDAHTVDGSHAADFAPASKGVTNGDSHGHNGGDGAAIAEGALSLSDVTTGDLSTARHGFAPKAPNDTAKFLRGDGAWAVPAGGGGLGYVLQVGTNNMTTFGDGATYYIGSYFGAAVQTVMAYVQIPIPKAGTLKSVYIGFSIGTPATPDMGEEVNVYFRKNSTDTLLGVIELTDGYVICQATGLSVSVAAGDYICIKLVNPTFSYNPQNIKINGTLYFE